MLTHIQVYKQNHIRLAIGDKIVPVGGTYTMNAKQAAELVNTIRPEAAVPVHFGGIVGRKEDGDVFANAVDKAVNVVFKIKF